MEVHVRAQPVVVRALICLFRSKYLYRPRVTKIEQFASQEGLSYDYKKVYDVRLPVQAVIKDFAKNLSLLAKVCTAYTGPNDLQSKLDGHELLLQVWCYLCSAF